MQLRLNWTFLLVLGVSVLGTSIAAWGISYASSHSRVLLMADDFTSLAEATVNDFSGLVTDLLLNSSMIVGSILNMETQAGVERSAATQQQVTQSSLQLLDFARNSTSQSQVQMETMVGDVGTFITGIIGDFETIAGTYAQELRYEFAMKVQIDFQNLVQARVNAVMRMPTFIEWGLFDPSKPINAPADASDLLILGALCEYADELGPGNELAMSTGTGRFYDCVPDTYGRYLETTIAPDGQSYNQSYVTWTFTPNTTGWKTLMQTTPPVWSVAGLNCRYPVQCVNEFPTCGYAPQCRPNVYPYFNMTEPQLHWTSVLYSYATHAAITALTWAVMNASAAPGMLHWPAIFSAPFSLANVNTFLQTIASTDGTHIAVILNDTDLTVMGSTGAACGPNETPPGPPLLPWWSAVRSCDPHMLAVGTYLMNARGGALAGQTTVTLNDTIWDIFVLPQSGLVYYVVVGMEQAAMYGAIWAAETNATQSLSTLSAHQTTNLLALGNQTLSYMQAKNLMQIQAMQTSLITELAQLANASQVLLNSSQAESTTQISAMLAQQMVKVGDVQTTQLSALAITTGWTIGVVIGLLVIVMIVAAFGTMRLTASLTEIITLMESVAEMKVEQLEVPRDAPVVEVARIQRAFHALVTRLAVYKTYMPAALFNPMEPISACKGLPGDESDQAGSVSTDSQLIVQSNSNGSGTEGRPRGVARATPSGSMTRCNVASLVVNVLRFRDHANDPNIITVFSNYLKLVHRAVSQARGNLDCVVGDQIFATFNAHIPCSDPVTAGASAALEIQTTFSKAAGAQFNCLMGLACGPMVAGSAGYTRSRTMVALGKPMKFAYLLSRLSRFENGAIVCDPSVAERIGFTHTLTPIDVVHLPRERPPRSYVLHLLTAKKEMATDEWLYQVGQEGNKWELTFHKLRAAKTTAETRTILKAYRDDHPADVWAKRLASRLHAWTPGLGVPLHETADAEAAGPEDAPGWDGGSTVDTDVPLMLTGHENGAKGKYRAQ